VSSQQLTVSHNDNKICKSNKSPSLDIQKGLFYEQHGPGGRHEAGRVPLPVSETWSGRRSGHWRRWISVMSFHSRWPTVTEARTLGHWQWRAFVRHQTAVSQVKPSSTVAAAALATGRLPGSTGLSAGILVAAATAIEFSISIDRFLVAPNGILIASIHQPASELLPGWVLNVAWIRGDWTGFSLINTVASLPPYSPLSSVGSVCLRNGVV